MGYDRGACCTTWQISFLWSSLTYIDRCADLVFDNHTQNHYAKPLRGFGVEFASFKLKQHCFCLFPTSPLLTVSKSCGIASLGYQKQVVFFGLPKRRKPTPSINHLNHWISIYFNLQEGNHFDLPVGDSFSHSHLGVTKRQLWEQANSQLKRCGQKSSKLFRSRDIQHHHTFIFLSHQFLFTVLKLRLQAQGSASVTCRSHLWCLTLCEITMILGQAPLIYCLLIYQFHFSTYLALNLAPNLSHSTYAKYVNKVSVLHCPHLMLPS